MENTQTTNSHNNLNDWDNIDNEDKTKHVSNFNIVTKESEHKEMGSNSNNMGYSESKSMEETNNNSKEKSKPHSNYKYSNEDLKDEGSNEEEVSIPISSNYMRGNSYKVTEEPESEENENQGEREKEENSFSRTTKSDKQTNNHSTTTQDKHTYMNGHDDINKTDKPNEQIIRHRIVQNKGRSSNELKINNQHYTHGQDLDSDDKILRVLSKNSNNEKSKHGNGFTDGRNSKRNHISNQELRRPHNRVYENDIKNAKIQEENNKSENHAGKKESQRKALSTEDESKFQKNYSSSKGTVSERNGNRFTTRGKTHINSLDKVKTENFVNNNKEKELKVRVTNKNINRENNSNKEEERFGSNTHIFNNKDENQYFELNRKDEKTSDEIFEHHILIHHPLFNHKNQDKTS